MVMLAVPLFRPKQVILEVLVLDTMGPGAFETTANAVDVHPLASLTTIL